MSEVADALEAAIDKAALVTAAGYLEKAKGWGVFIGVDELREAITQLRAKTLLDELVEGLRVAVAPYNSPNSLPSSESRLLIDIPPPQWLPPGTDCTRLPCSSIHALSYPTQRQSLLAPTGSMTNSRNTSGNGRPNKCSSASDNWLMRTSLYSQ